MSISSAGSNSSSLSSPSVQSFSESDVSLVKAISHSWLAETSVCEESGGPTIREHCIPVSTVRAALVWQAKTTTQRNQMCTYLMHIQLSLAFSWLSKSQLLSGMDTSDDASIDPEVNISSIIYESLQY